MIKHRGRAAIIDAGYLPGKLLHVRRRVSCNEQLGFVAMPGQGNVARGRTPMLGMIEIGLVERAALAAIDRAGIAVPELLKLSGIEDERLRLPAVELHGDLAARRSAR